MSYMNTWMVPKNKRTLLYTVEALPLFVLNVGNEAWVGDRNLQRKFEEALESSGLKRVGDPYDSNSGGARTYAAQLVALGLIFRDERADPPQFRPTLAGEAILNGEDPLAILQNQLLKLQYPSVYSLSRGVRLNPDFKVRPFLFVLSLLLDPEIRFLTKGELGRFVLPYAKTRDDIGKVKKMILSFRTNPEGYILPSSFMTDTASPKTKNHSLEKRIVYLEDKANIFMNYLESVQLTLRPEEKNKMQLNPLYADKVFKFCENEPALLDTDNKIQFQRRFGLDLKKTKDGRQFSGCSVSAAAINDSIVKNKFFSVAKSRLFLDIDDELVDIIHTSTGVSKKEIVKSLDKLSTHGLAYFEEKYLEMAANGREECIEFEIATQQIFEKRLGFEAKHVGQIKPTGRPGGNPDVVFRSESESAGGIVDAKAYKAYSITNDHKNRMKEDYIPNFDEHFKDTDLKLFIYVAGGFNKGFEKSLSTLVHESSIPGSGITAKNLLRLSRKVQEEAWSHKRILEIFSSNREINLLENTAHQLNLYATDTDLQDEVQKVAEPRDE